MNAQDFHRERADLIAKLIYARGLLAAATVHMKVDGLAIPSASRDFDISRIDDYLSGGLFAPVPEEASK